MTRSSTGLRWPSTPSAVTPASRLGGRDPGGARNRHVLPERAGASTAELDDLCARLPSAALEDGFAFLSTHRVRGRTALRLCTINPRTTREDVERTIDRLTELAQGALS